MIAQAGLDALVIATPPDLHYAMALASLDRGLHVLCEKPLALDAGQAREMLAKAEAAGVVHMTFFTYRWMPFYRYLRQLVQEGYVGRCFQILIRYPAGYMRRYAWRLDAGHAQGALGDLGCHMIDLARWLVGDIARVSAHLGAFVDRPRTDGQPYASANDAAALLLEFANSAQGIIQVSFAAHEADRGQEQHIVLHGEQGTLEMSFRLMGSEGGAIIRGARHDSKRFEEIAVPDEMWGDVDRSDFLSSLFSGVFLTQPVGDRLFVDAILEGRQVSPSFYDGLKAQEVIEAALRSDAEGRRVSVPGEAGAGAGARQIGVV